MSGTDLLRTGKVNSLERWFHFRLGPQRRLECAIDDLEPRLTATQKVLLSEINKKYHELMRISERLAADLVAANEMLANGR